jgi:hypothetical protein
MADADIDIEADGYHPTRERSTATKKLASKDLVGVRGLAGAFKTPRQLQSAPAPHKPDQTLAEFLDRVACTVLFSMSLAYLSRESEVLTPGVYRRHAIWPVFHRGVLRVGCLGRPLAASTI